MEPFEDLSSSIPLLAPLWLLAVLSGLLFQVSNWFGGTVLFAGICAFCWVEFRIFTAKTVSVKVLEVQLLSVSTIVLTSLSALASFQFPVAVYTIDLILTSMMLPHLTLIFRTIAQLNHWFLFAYSSALLVSCSIITAVFGPRFSLIAAMFYAILAQLRSIFMLREKIPVRRLKYAFLVLAIISGASCMVMSRFNIPIALILASAFSSTYFVFFDFLEHWMRFPSAPWTDKTSRISFFHVFFKYCVLINVACWAGWGAVSGTLEHDAKKRAESEMRCLNLPKGSKEPCYSKNGEIILYTIFFPTIPHFILYWIYYYAFHTQVPETQPLNRNTACRIFAIVILVSFKISVACYYWFDASPVPPAPLTMMLIGCLFLLVCYLLDTIRAFLLRFNRTLCLAFAVLAVYFFLSALYVAYTNDEKTGLDGWVKDQTRVVILMTAVYLCILLFAHFGFAILEQKDEEEKLKNGASAPVVYQAPRAAAAPAAPAVIPAAVAAVPAAPVAVPVARDVDSDYDSDENGQEEQPAL